MSEDFIPDVLYHLVEDMAYPRMMGTAGEKKVIAQIKDSFQQRGFSPEEVMSHQFRTTTWLSGIFFQVLTGVMALIIFGLIFTWMYVGAIYNWVWFAGFAAAAAFFGSKADGTTWKVGALDTENVYVQIPAQNVGNKQGTILFSSHFDSKSQVYPTIVRAAFFLFGIILGVCFLLVALANLFLVTFDQPSSSILLIFAQVLGWPAGVCFFLLMFNKVGNRSPGAGDNASGTAIVLELARVVRERGGLENYDAIFITFSAEEVGVLGSAHWLKAHRSEYDPKTSFMFNFDMVAKPTLQYMSHIGFGKKATNRRLNPLADAVAKDLGIALPSFWMPVGAMTDRWPFAKAGWEAIDFITKGEAIVTHTKQDNMAVVDGTILAQACQVALNCAQRMDQGNF